MRLDRVWLAAVCGAAALGLVACDDGDSESTPDAGAGGDAPPSLCESQIQAPADAGTPDGAVDGSVDGSVADGGGADGGTRPECTGDGTAPTYEGAVQGLLEEQCVGCHDDPPMFGAMVPLTTYEQTQADSLMQPGRPVHEVAADLVRGIDGPRMPTSCQLPEHLIELLVAWSEAGAPRCDP